MPEPGAHFIESHAPVGVVQAATQSGWRSIRHAVEETAGETNGGGAIGGGGAVPITDGVNLVIDYRHGIPDHAVCASGTLASRDQSEASSARSRYSVVNTRAG